MNSRERVRTIIAGQAADRCGFWLGNPHPDTWPLYLAAFASALARVAYADGSASSDELLVIRKVLREVAHLSEGEIGLVLELALSHARMQHANGHRQIIQRTLLP